MDAVRVFDEHAQEYDRWFDEHEHLYQAEVNALSRFTPPAGRGVEIGVGTGRFSVPFGVKLGIEPSRPMAQVARSRGIAVCQAWGERLPFHDDQFDFALMVTVICFVADAMALLRETRRVLKPGGRFILGFIDRDSPLGQLYQSRKESDQFYREARFYSVEQVANYVRQVCFGGITFCQTVFGVPDETSGKVEPVRDGYGDGAFVVLRAKKTS